VGKTRPKILFVAEAVTLAHVVRPLALAQSLAREDFEIHFACADGFDSLFSEQGLTRWKIHSISSEHFMQALANGTPPYSFSTLQGYVVEDCALLDKIKPDVVISDFRLSLAISARLRSVRHITLANAYWSPYYRVREYPIPDIRAVRWLGLPLVKCFYPFIRPLFFRQYAAPMNRLRRAHGLPPLGSLLDVYTAGDHVFYLDSPHMVPLENLPAHHHFLGPVVWSPEDTTWPNWDDLPEDRPVVYLSLGSSGASDALAPLLNVLAQMPVTVLCSSAGQSIRLPASPNIRAAPFLPGNRAAARSSLVICNGGSPAVYQALEQGKPVLAVPSNLDQYLSAQALTRVGAGATIRSSDVRLPGLAPLIESLLTDPRFTERAVQFRIEMDQFNGVTEFPRQLKECLA
jgi:UDP:flavonoid glycosyltransferase YjiC (YdhE family)